MNILCSTADFAVFALVQHRQRATAIEVTEPFNFRLWPLAEHYPSVDQWLGRIETLPFRERTCPPHWR